MTNHHRRGGVLAPKLHTLEEFLLSKSFVKMSQELQSTSSSAHTSDVPGSDALSKVELDSLDSASSKSSLSGSPPNSPAIEPSFLSDSDADVSAKEQQLKLAARLGTMSDLKDKSVGEWNGVTAHKVYKAFNVKRYKVDEEYILCPVRSTATGSDEVMTIDEILKNTSWSEVELKMNQILKVLDKGNAHLLSSGLRNTEDFYAAKASLLRNIRTADDASDSEMRSVRSNFHITLEEILEEVEQSLKKKKPHREKFFAGYFLYMVEMFTAISDVKLRCPQSLIYASYEITLSSFGKVPEPDFHLAHAGRMGILAVGEVKSGRKLHFASHKGHRPKSYKDRQELNPIDAVCPEKKRKLMEAAQDMDEDEDELIDQEERDEKLNDTFDADETQIEKMRKETLPDHIMHLDFTEKKQIRCFMPQLLGQMLACTSITSKCVPSLQHSYMTQVMGIGVVGFQVQMVMLVLKDAKNEILRPTATDIEKNPNIRPYLYVTRRLNLFNGKHLRIIFRILYALGSL